MPCKLSESKVVFSESEIEIRPYEISINSEKTRFSHGKVKVSREAGELVRDRGEFGETVYIEIAGHKQDRYYLDKNSVKLQNSEAWITLYDALKVLDSGAVNRHFHDVTLETVVDYVFERRDDPLGVINGVVHPKREEPVTVQNMRGAFFGQDDDEEGILDSINDAISNFIGDTLTVAAELHTGADVPDTSIGFTDETVLSCINKIEKQFLVEFWVDIDGFLHYTEPALIPTNAFVIGAKDEAIRLKEYNVATISGKVNKVRLKSKYRYLTPAPEGSYAPFREVSMGMFAYAEAWIPGMEGESDTPEDPINVHEPVPLEYAARRRLLSHFMAYKSGNIVINSVASSEKRGIANLNVGDTILTDDEIEDHCNRDVETGLFVVNGVTHRINPRQGWETVVKVSGVPKEGIEQKSWLMDTKSNTRYEDIEDYLTDQQEALNAAQLEGQDGGA